MKNWYEIIFNPGEYIYFGYTHAEEGTARPRYQGPCLPNDEANSDKFNFFILNPYNPTAQNAKGEHLTAYRNILVEFDSTPLDQQIKLVQDLRMPYTLCTYSGGKSYHFVISLAQDVTLQEYEQLVERVYLAVGSTCDPQCKNPNRFSRKPNGVRSNGVRQEWKVYGDRIDNNLLEKWLLSRNVPPHAVKSKTLAKPLTPGHKATLGNLDLYSKVKLLHPCTKRFLNDGAPEGKRNRTLFVSSCDAARCLISFDDWLDILDRQGCIELPESEILTCVRSAYQSNDY